MSVAVGITSEYLSSLYQQLLRKYGTDILVQSYVLGVTLPDSVRCAVEHVRVLGGQRGAVAGGARKHPPPWRVRPRGDRLRRGQQRQQQQQRKRRPHRDPKTFSRLCLVTVV